MGTLRGRFVLSHILPLLLVTPLVAIGLIYALETQVLLADLTNDLTERAELIAQTLRAQPNIWSDSEQADNFVSEIRIHVDGRVLLLQPDGELFASSDLDQSDQVSLPLDLEGLDAAIAGSRSVKVYYGWLEHSAQVLLPVTDFKNQIMGIVGVTQTLQGVSSQLGRLRGWVLAILAIELILGAIVGFLLAVRLERPIGRVAAAIVNIADGHPIEPVSQQGPSEIRRLAKAVNILDERLRTLEEMRRRSLANIVHELGRPLGALRAAIHVLRQGADEDPEVRHELLEAMEGEVKRMQPLLDDLAQLHGQVVGALELSRQPTVLSDWLPPLLIPWRAAALDKGVQWKANIPPDLPTLDLDPDRMARVIGNLVSNAIKYTPAGGAVSVSAGVDSALVWIEVQDNGPGIIPEEQERVFEPFYRSHQERRFPQGLGLGLTIARDLVEAHGGRLELNSTPGRGSRFTVYLPVLCQEMPPQP